MKLWWKVTRYDERILYFGEGTVELNDKDETKIVLSNRVNTDVKIPFESFFCHGFGNKSSELSLSLFLASIAKNWRFCRQKEQHLFIWGLFFYGVINLNVIYEFNKPSNKKILILWSATQRIFLNVYLLIVFFFSRTRRVLMLSSFFLYFGFLHITTNNSFIAQN